MLLELAMFGALVIARQHGWVEWEFWVPKWLERSRA